MTTQKAHIVQVEFFHEEKNLRNKTVVRFFDHKDEVKTLAVEFLRMDGVYKAVREKNWNAGWLTRWYFSWKLRRSSAALNSPRIKLFMSILRTLKENLVLEAQI